MSVATVSPRQLLADAQRLISQPPSDPGLSGILPRATAVLARQALEAQLLVVLGARFPGIERCALRAQLLCLQTHLDDKDLAGEVAHTWWALTGACHHRLYELAPIALELEAWLGVVHRFLQVSSQRHLEVEASA
jgi:hypothetical protein